MKKIDSREQLLNKLNTEPQIWVYFYAPMCGTCEIARSFIKMVEQVRENEFVHEVDLNFLKNEAFQWEVQSVPCLIYFERGEPQKKLYAFESVSTVFEFTSDQNSAKKGD
ncbi:thiol reductase thioredoxin [Salipaludibacillus keqinensis]|uniref:Thiol reductase thioredoxin n=1 Tax=Salipaludibacillus keqinensis TaxID=2045207 RepID=A0A323TJ43_9BACI|nr:thioredoxin family protein [Salipaludibacillus keqinensis]PYZ94560.1 thiol reductase thioredoxin [Salipaludibacillus keqinensis]